jgi:hypothetical protein
VFRARAALLAAPALLAASRSACEPLRDAAPEDMARLLRGERVPPERVYFRTAPCFETAAPAHAWLHRRLFVGFGQRLPDCVHIRVFAV